MSDIHTARSWPEYLPRAQNDLIAIGAITLNYGQLENRLKYLFSAATGMKHEHLIGIVLQDTEQHPTRGTHRTCQTHRATDYA